MPDDFFAEAAFDNKEFSKEVTGLLSSLNEGAGAKLSLLKVLIVKCDNNVSTYRRLRSGIGSGDYQEVDRLLAELEESNHASLNDLQEEMAGGINIVQAVGMLAE